MATADNDPASQTGYLVLDTESIPDGKLLGLIRFPEDGLSPEAAIDRAQADARENSRDGSDFLPVAFQIPVSVCVARVGADFRLQALACLDAPQFRTREMVETFWRGVDQRYSKATLVTFNGRGFDLPLLELAAFRYGCAGRDYFRGGRARFNGQHFDLMDWLTNYGGCRLSGGLNLLSKLLGKPGKMGVAGHQVYGMYQAGKLQEINDYCMADTLDTYFVFLRTRVLTGDITLAQEQELVEAAKTWITAKSAELPALSQYLANWGVWTPWP